MPEINGIPIKSKVLVFLEEYSMWRFAGNAVFLEEYSMWPLSFIYHPFILREISENHALQQPQTAADRSLAHGVSGPSAYSHILNF